MDGWSHVSACAYINTSIHDSGTDVLLSFSPFQNGERRGDVITNKQRFREGGSVV